MNKADFETIREAIRGSMGQHLQGDDQERSRSDQTRMDADLVAACKALADNPAPAVLAALGMFAVRCLLDQTRTTRIAEAETSRLLRRI